MKRLYEFSAFVKNNKKNQEQKVEVVYAIGNTMDEAKAEVETFCTDVSFTGKESTLNQDW